MTISLADRMTVAMAHEARPMTADEIAREVHARIVDVRQVLEEDRRFARTLPGRRSPKAKLYVVLDLGEAQDESGGLTTEEVAA